MLVMTIAARDKALGLSAKGQREWRGIQQEAESRKLGTRK
jgi:hypothetical protein